jgi:protein-disulfide isomerase
MKWDGILTGVLVISAVVTTTLVVRRELFPQHVASSSQTPVFVPQWRTLISTGIRMGKPDAPVQVIEFADFECPFCASFHESYAALVKKYPGDLALTFIHLPIPGHRFALPAARASECASEQDRFQAMHDQLLARQNEFGLTPWSEYAVRAGLSDRAAFESCMNRQGEMPRVEAGRVLARRMSINATPTIIFNGWQMAPPGVEKLEEMVREVRAGKKPV